MANESITFHCPACGIKLTVPSSLAGITGPCPTCRTLIQAPIPAAPQQMAPPAAAYQAPVQAPPAYQPPPAPVYQTPPPPAYQPPPVQRVEATVEIPVIPVQAPPSAAQSGPVVLKPEPRQLPNRPHPAEVVAKQMPEPSTGGESRKNQAAPLPRHPHRSGPFVRFAMLLLFVLAAGALMWGVWKFLNQAAVEPPDSRPAAAPQGETPPPANLDPAPAAPVPATSALPTPPAEKPVLQPVPDLPVGVEPKSPAMDALAVLEKFVTRSHWPSACPLIETKTAEPELVSSCLAGPLPPAPKMLLEFQESNGVEDVVDFYYNVDFEMEGQPPEPPDDARPHPRWQSAQGGGGSFPRSPSAAASPPMPPSPSDKAGVFQVIVSALASCTDPKIPEPREKTHSQADGAGQYQGDRPSVLQQPVEDPRDARRRHLQPQLWQGEVLHRDAALEHRGQARSIPIWKPSRSRLWTGTLDPAGLAQRTPAAVQHGNLARRDPTRGCARRPGG